MKKKEFNRLYFKYKIGVFSWFLTYRSCCFFVQPLSNALVGVEAIKNQLMDMHLFLAPVSIKFFEQQVFSVASSTYLLTWGSVYDLRRFLDLLACAEKESASPFYYLKFVMWVFKGRLYPYEDFLVFVRYCANINIRQETCLTLTNVSQVFNLLIVRHALLPVFQHFYVLFFRQQLTKIRGYF